MNEIARQRTSAYTSVITVFEAQCPGKILINLCQLKTDICRANVSLRGIYLPSERELKSHSIEDHKIELSYQVDVENNIALELISIRKIFTLLQNGDSEIVELLQTRPKSFLYCHQIFKDILSTIKNLPDKSDPKKIHQLSISFHDDLRTKYKKINEVNQKSLLVGGAVRDKIMGIPPKDFDYVVKDFTHEKMLACGFIHVGKSFPVYLHPLSSSEYVLLRGVDSSSLVSDLEARDLTINSMAMDYSGKLIDPFGGQKDIQDKILRHTSLAFSDDPLRVMRVARFYATLKDFKVANETKALMKKVSMSEDYKSIAGERILAEMKKAFTSKKPSLFFECLVKANCLAYTFRELYNLIDVPLRENYPLKGCCYTQTMLVLDATREMTRDFDVLIAALVHDLDKAITPREEMLQLIKTFCLKFKISTYGRKLSFYTSENYQKLHSIFEMTPTSIFRLLKAGDFIRNPKFIKDFVKICMAQNLVKLNQQDYLQGKFLLECQSAINEVKVQDIVEGEVNEQKVERAYSKIIEKTRKDFKHRI